MNRLPQAGEQNWGATLNDFLLVAHHKDGTIRTVHNMRSVVNVRDYGAVGDGMTDDSEALHRGIDAAAGGGTLFIPHGVYLTGKLLLPSNITICGDGYGSVLKLRDGTLDALFTNQDWQNGNDHIILRDLRLAGNRMNNVQSGPNPFPHSSADQDKSHGINFRYVEDARLENLTIADFYFDGIYLGTSAPDQYPDGEEDRSSGSNRNIVGNNRIIGNGRNGISITRGTDNQIVGNILQENNIGTLDAVPDPFLAGAITIEPNGEWYDVSRNIVQSNHVLDNHFNGIQVLENWTSTGILLSSNIISGTTRHGIAAALISGLIIQGNHVSSSEAAGMALGLGTGIKDAVVSANMVTNNGSNGILINGAQGERIVVSANVTMGNAHSNSYAHGIDWVEAKEVTLIGNICLENGPGPQMLAYGAEPIYIGNRTEPLNVGPMNRIVRGDDLSSGLWRMYGSDTELYLENQRTGNNYVVPIEAI